MRFGYALLLLLVAQLAFAQPIAECEGMSPEDRDGCYLSRARLPGQCNQISHMQTRDQCFKAIAETYAQNYQQCSLLYVQHQPLCYSRITYENNEDIRACDSLHPDYREACFIYYVMHRSPGLVAQCEAIPQNYQDECRRQVFEFVGPKDQDDCMSLFGDRYYEDCVAYVGSQSNPISMAVSFIVSAWEFVSSPQTIAITAIVISAIILGIFARIWKRASEQQSKKR